MRAQIHKLLHVIPPSAVNPFNISAGLSRGRWDYCDFCICKSGANRHIGATTPGSSAGLLSTVNHPRVSHWHHAPVAVVSALRPSHLRHQAYKKSFNLAAGGTARTSKMFPVQVSEALNVAPSVYSASRSCGFTYRQQGSEECWEFTQLSWKGLRGSYPVGMGSRVILTVIQCPKRPQTGAGGRLNLRLWGLIFYAP